MQPEYRLFSRTLLLFRSKNTSPYNLIHQVGWCAVCWRRNGVQSLIGSGDPVDRKLGVGCLLRVVPLMITNKRVTYTSFLSYAGSTKGAP